MFRARVAVVSIFMVAVCGVAVGSGGIANAALPNDGYILLGADGGIFNWNLPFHGSPAGSPGSCAPSNDVRVSRVAGGSCLSIALTPTADGYWVLGTLTGLVMPSGNAVSYSDPSHRFANSSPEFNPEYRQIVATPSGHGYWVYEVTAADTGHVDPYGDAGYFGDTHSIQTSHPELHIAYNGSPVAMAATADGKGYWEVYSDGGVFAFGDAHFYGSMAGRALAQNIVGITATADGKGYWLVAADGGVFAFGDARFAGSAVGIGGRGPIVGMARNPAGPGYWLTSTDGGVYSFGGAQFFGSVPQFIGHLNAPIVAIVARTAALT